MKNDQHQRHIQMFQRQYLYETTEHKLDERQQQMQKNMSYLLIGSNVKKNNNQKNRNQVDLLISQTYSQVNPISHRIIKINNKIFKFGLKYYLSQLIIAYVLTIGFLMLNKIIYYPFFQTLMIFVVSLSVTHLNITVLFILLAIPMAIANYNLYVWVLTYPQIIICYFSYYLFSKQTWKHLLWVVPTTVFCIFGFIVLPAISIKLNKNRQVLYYLFPWLMLPIKMISSVVFQSIFYPTNFLLQIHFFIFGLWYGLILTLSISNIQFWYLIILLTLDIINTRFQILLSVLKRVTKYKQKPSIVQAQASGYMSLNSYHIIIFVYLVCYLNLNSAHFNFSMQNYERQWYKPTIVWIFIVIYETISLIRLKKRQRQFIIGYEVNNIFETIKRGISLSLGLWFFYLGFGLPSQFFNQ